MEKILIGVCVPSIQMNYDAFIPLDTPVGELAEIIANGVAEMSDGKYAVSHLEMLSLKEPESLLNPQLTLRDYSVRDGMKLYLL